MGENFEEVLKAIADAERGPPATPPATIAVLRSGSVLHTRHTR